MQTLEESTVIRPEKPWSPSADAHRAAEPSRARRVLAAVGFAAAAFGAGALGSLAMSRRRAPKRSWFRAR